jgi:hypothetical protein
VNPRNGMILETWSSFDRVFFTIGVRPVQAFAKDGEHKNPGEMGPPMG